MDNCTTCQQFAFLVGQSFWQGGKHPDSQSQLGWRYQFLEQLDQHKEVPTLTSNCEQNYTAWLFDIRSDKRLDQVYISVISLCSNTSDKSWKVYKGEIYEIFPANLQRDIVLQKWQLVFFW